MALRQKITKSLFFGFIFSKLANYITTGHYLFPEEKYSLIGSLLLGFVYSVTFFFIFFADQRKPYPLYILIKGWLFGLGIAVTGEFGLLLTTFSPVTLNIKQVTTLVPGLLLIWILFSGLICDSLSKKSITKDIYPDTGVI